MALYQELNFEGYELELNILIGALILVYAFFAFFIFIYEMLVFKPQKAEVLGFKKHETKYNRFLPLPVIHYVVTFKNEQGKQVEASVKLHDTHFRDLTHMRIYTHGDRAKFINIAALGYDILFFSLIGVVFALVLYPSLTETDLFASVALTTIILVFAFEYKNRRQFTYRDPSFLLVREYKAYKRHSALLKMKMDQAEKESLSEPGKLLTYEQAVRFRDRAFKDNIVQLIIPIILLAGVYFAGGYIMQIWTHLPPEPK